MVDLCVPVRASPVSGVVRQRFIFLFFVRCAGVCVLVCASPSFVPVSSVLCERPLFKNSIGTPLVRLGLVTVLFLCARVLGSVFSLSLPAPSGEGGRVPRS